MDSIQGQRMQQETDNARIKKLNRKKGLQAGAAAVQSPPLQAGAAAAQSPPPAQSPLARPWRTTRAQDAPPDAQPRHVFVLPRVGLPRVGLPRVAALAQAVQALELAAPAPAQAVEALPLVAPAPAPAVEALPPAAPAQPAAPEPTTDATAMQRVACLAEARASILAQQQRDRECLVCMDAIKMNLFVPCGHVDTCNVCAGERERKRVLVCPFARAPRAASVRECSFTDRER